MPKPQYVPIRQSDGKGQSGAGDASHVDGAARSKKKYRQLLIFGGSQGAAAINKSVVEMLPFLRAMKNKIRILHQTGAADWTQSGTLISR